MESAILNTLLRWAMVSVSLSLFYILFSLGLTLIFGFHEVLNFAHGAVYMAGAFVGLFFYNVTGSFYVALAAGTVCSMLIGALSERGVISRLYGTDPANSFLATYAIGLALVGVVKFAAGSRFRRFDIPPELGGVVTIGKVTVTHYQLFFIGVVLLLIFLVGLLLTKTKIGIIIRAGTHSRSGVEVLGINVKNYFTLLFAIGSGLAGVAGVLMAPLLNVFPGMGDEIIIWAFVIVIIGGLGSYRGALIGGILIGLLHGIGGFFLGPYVTLATFAILIIILLIKPEGIGG